jgi:hypothetical protein
VFPAGQVAQADSVSVGAWNPTTGADDTAFVVVRQRSVASMPSTGLPLWYTTCTRVGGCATLQPLIVGGSQLFSRSTVSVAVSNAVGTQPRMAWVLFEDRRISTFDDDQSMRLARLVPNAGGMTSSLLTVKGAANSGLPGRVEAFVTPNHSATGLAFTSSNRAMLTFEVNFLDYTIPQHRMSDRALTSTSTDVLTITHDANQWNHSREATGSYADAATGGTIRTIWEQGPGRAPFLLYDPRPVSLVTTTGTEFTAQRIRMTMTAEARSTVYAQMFSLAENTGMRGYNDYDEQTTIGFYLCRTLESSSFARRSPDLAGSAAGPIICPGGAAFQGGGDLINFHEEGLQMHCRPPPLCNLPDPRFTARVAQWLGNRSLAGSSFIATGSLQRLPPIYTSVPNVCAAGNRSEMHVFPNNWRVTQ